MYAFAYYFSKTINQKITVQIYTQPLIFVTCLLYSRATPHRCCLWVQRPSTSLFLRFDYSNASGLNEAMKTEQHEHRRVKLCHYAKSKTLWYISAVCCLCGASLKFPIYKLLSEDPTAVTGTQGTLETSNTDSYHNNQRQNLHYILQKQLLSLSQSKIMAWMLCRCQIWLKKIFVCCSKLAVLGK